MGIRKTFTAVVVFLSFIGFLFPALWSFIFSALVAWSIGDVVFKLRTTSDLSDADEFTSYLFFIVILTGVGAFASNLAITEVLAWLGKNPLIAYYVIPIGKTDYLLGAFVFYLGLSALTCFVSLIAVRVKDRSSLNWLERKILHKQREAKAD